VKTELKAKFGKHRLVILTILVCSVLLISAFAISYMWSTNATVGITSSSPYIKVYYQGKEITSLDLGNFVPGTHFRISSLQIRNTHPNATIWVRWNSTLPDVTDKITEYWFGAPGANEVPINPGDWYSSSYDIYVADDCPLSTYSWTLYLYG
jgi:hypothetical protein